MTLRAMMTAKARKERQDRSAFKVLLTTPAVGAVTLPAGARLALRSVAGCAAGTTAATITGASNRTIKTPLLAASGIVKLDHLDRGVVVTASAGFEVLLDIGLGRRVKIGQGA